MGENGHDDGKTGKYQQETDGQGPGDDQSPKRHGERIHQHGLDGRLNGDWNVDCWRYDWVLDLDTQHRLGGSPFSAGASPPPLKVGGSLSRMAPG